MADDVVVTTGTSGNVSTIPNGTRFSAEEVTTLNGGSVTAQLAQRIIAAMRTADGTALDVNSTNPMPVSLASVPLGTGAATAANQATANTTLAAIETALASLGTEATLADILTALSSIQAEDFATQTTLAAVLAKLDASIAVTGTFWQATQPVSGTVTANAGTNLNTSALALESGGVLDDVLAAVLALGVAIGDLATGAETQPVSVASLPLPTGAATSAKQDTVIGHLDGVEGLLTTIDADTGALAGTVSGSEVQVDVVGALPAGTNNIGDVDVLSLPKVATETQSNVPSSATSVTLLASNASRKCASIYNDSTQVLYVKFGATASATSYKVAMAAGSYYEFPEPCYTGVVDGIWSSANGNARVSEG
jgi:hypothetical protein